MADPSRYHEAIHSLAGQSCRSVIPNLGAAALSRSMSAGVGGPTTSPPEFMATFGQELLEHTRRAYQDVTNGLIARAHELVRDRA